MSKAPNHAALYGLLAVLSAAALAVAGCGSTVQGDSELVVYASLPTSGKDADYGKAMAAGAEQALDDAGGEAAGAPVSLEVLDDADGATWTQSSVAANARNATQDSTSIGYIGEFDSRATAISAPITNEAGLLQLSPVGVPEDLLVAAGSDVPADIQTTGDRTLGALFPSNAHAAVIVPEGQAEDSDYFDYGHESMALVLDSIDRAEDPLSRADVVAAFLATTDRTGKTGTYTIGTDGAAIYSSESG